MSFCWFGLVFGLRVTVMGFGAWVFCLIEFRVVGILFIGEPLVSFLGVSAGDFSPSLVEGLWTPRVEAFGFSFREDAVSFFIVSGEGWRNC